MKAISAVSEISRDSRSLGITKYQLFCVSAASLSSLNFGWNYVITNLPGDIITTCLAGPKHNINGLPSCIPTTSFIWGIAVGSYALGALIGAIMCTWFANKYGRRFVLLYSNIIGLAAALLFGLPVNIEMVIAGRVVAGIAQGAANGAFSSYIIEITTPHARSSLASMLQLATRIGQLLALVCALGMLKPPLWRVLFSLTSVFCIASMVLMVFCIESPKWLALQGRTDEARVALQRLRKGADITEEFDQMTVALFAVGPDSKYTVSVLGVLLGRTPVNLRHQLLLGAMAMVFQQLSGINVVAFYSTALFSTIFPTTDADRDASKPTFPQILSVVIAVVGTAAALVGMLLANYLGRRTLMLISHGLMAVFCVPISLGIIYNLPPLTITMVFLYFTVFFFGAGPLPWVIPNEITPTYAASAIMAINSGMGYICVFLISVSFSPMLAALQGYTFLVFAGANALAFMFFFFFLPETKGRLVDDLVRVHSVGIHNVLKAKYKVDAYSRAKSPV
ncbi:general substrate transporter [Coemansia spiralis]|uniref:Bifunctional purine biosynthesis protein PurH n=1 Tax=Coemansia umbellata TaxID=1424467 RepID=A0ABQ8PG83_9FUNG|nr:general substrate transporter [Coemansia spiralis]KAJ1988629.1 Bifunctional purine biosynthesis protein PurH [Coemansia umbellata]